MKNIQHILMFKDEKLGIKPYIYIYKKLSRYT